MVLMRFQLLTGNSGVTLCNDIHGCRGSYVESSKHRDLASLIWPRASGEGAAGEGAAGEGEAGEGAQGEGAQGEPPSNPPSEGAEPPPSIPPSEPSDFLADSDGSLPDRPSSDIGIDDDSSKSPESQEVLPLPTYAANGQRYYDLMMQAVHLQPKREPTYASFNDRYRLRSEPRSPLDPNPDDSQDIMDAVLSRGLDISNAHRQRSALTGQ